LAQIVGFFMLCLFCVYVYSLMPWVDLSAGFCCIVCHAVSWYSW